MMNGLKNIMNGGAMEVQNNEFYTKEFAYGDTVLSRADLECLPCPFCTENVTDEQMEAIVFETDLSTRERLRLSDSEHIDLDNNKHSEVWWEEMEAAANRQNVSYYEDL